MSLPEKPKAIEPASPLMQMNDVELNVDFIIGTGRLKVRDCMRLERQSIVALDQSGGADLELRVHGVAVALGEVVIMDDITALRLTRISPPAGLDV
jgi:flagellar motor switch/type III secretory pathway protein FliN